MNSTPCPLRVLAMTAVGCSLVAASGSSSNVFLSVAMSCPLISWTRQPKASNRLPSGSMFIASEVGPDPENPLASTMATRLPSL